MALYQLGPFCFAGIRLPSLYQSIYYYRSLGFAASILFGVPFTIGASASICGLIGAILYYGKSRSGYYGQAIFKQAMGWVVGLVVFGIIIGGINNWAHGGGNIIRILLAFLMGYNDNKQESAWE